MRKKTRRSLADVMVGKSAIVVELHGGKVFVNRMAALGFTPGAEVQIVRNYMFGPIIALVRGTRVALGRGVSLKVWVEQQGNDQE